MRLRVSRRAAARAAPESSLDSRERGLLRSPPTLGNQPGAGGCCGTGAPTVSSRAPYSHTYLRFMGRFLDRASGEGGTGGWPGRAVRSQGFTHPRE